MSAASSAIVSNVRDMRAAPRTQRGLSLIEIMVALAIAAILLLGLSQIFVGSKNVYRLQEGMARVQENARFALQYLEENVRMAGYMGCGNDVDLTTRMGSPPAFLNHLAGATSAPGVVPLVQNPSYPQRFDRPIEAFTYTGASVDGQPPSFGGQDDWTPRLPDDLLGTAGGDSLGSTFAKGSDIIVMRLVRPESTAMLGNFDMTAGTFNVADPTMVKPLNVYALTNCANARIFKASARGAGSNPVLAGPVDNPLFLTADHGSTWTGTYANMQFDQSGTMLNAEVHPAQYIVLYVGIRNPGAENAPVLMLQSGADGSVTHEELVDDVEVMRAWFGVDTTGSGNVSKFVAADNADVEANLAATNPAQRNIEWRKVLSARIALLMRSPDIATGQAHTGDAPNDNVFRLFDARVQAPNDYRYRDVFSTTIALRNRLSNY